MRAQQLGLEGDVQGDVGAVQARLFVAQEDWRQLQAERPLQDPSPVQGVHRDRHPAQEPPSHPPRRLLFGLPGEGGVGGERVEDADLQGVRALHHVRGGVGPLVEDDRELGLLVPDRGGRAPLVRGEVLALELGLHEGPQGPVSGPHRQALRALYVDDEAARVGVHGEHLGPLPLGAELPPRSEQLRQSVQVEGEHRERDVLDHVDGLDLLVLLHHLGEAQPGPDVSEVLFDEGIALLEQLQGLRGDDVLRGSEAVVQLPRQAPVDPAFKVGQLDVSLVDGDHLAQDVRRVARLGAPEAPLPPRFDEHLALLAGEPVPYLDLLRDAHPEEPL